jgi:hypothetical protein
VIACLVDLYGLAPFTCLSGWPLIEVLCEWAMSQLWQPGNPCDPLKELVRRLREQADVAQRPAMMQSWIERALKDDPEYRSRALEKLAAL